MAVTLSAREKKQWEEIKALADGNSSFELNDADVIRMKKVLDLLQEQGFIKNLEVFGANLFSVLGNLQDFEDWLNDEEQEESKKRQHSCLETRQSRASAIVNSQPTIKGFRILDAAAEELLHALLSVYDGNSDRLISTDSSVFPSGYRNDPMSTALEMEKLAMYGVVTSTQFFKNGALKTVLMPQGITYFEDKARALRQNEEIPAVSPAKPPRKKYDVFLSHANADKSEYVDELYLTLRKLGVNIFYDSEILSWGDNWKQVILDGTEKSEFAIIVISDNFFGREWTERELTEFMKRQNANGQKIVLPLLYNITFDQLKEQYPSLGEIQAIRTDGRSKEEIAILFAKELIKRYK